ncbi:unnamed protein product [Eruca vesicaria subsp. sativa]|uniref:NYN domain-containing protein n=1 Tax=Eruca vesicaria subsp. sativa TaxID=29727 RepID=A0ABC8LL71_ERUVS|nr:unnamed protein product [Eruca vesicaria subsp. sativa]
MGSEGQTIEFFSRSKAYKDKLGAVNMTYYILMNVEYAGRGHCNVAGLWVNHALRVLGCLKSRGHTSLLIEPPHDEECVFSVESLVENAQLLGGGKPIHKDVLTPEDLCQDYCGPRRFINEEEDYNNHSTEMIDFSERAKHVKGKRTVVFWDALDCPFPLCFSSSPDVIFKKISKALFKRGFSRKISIWAYVEKDSELLVCKKTWAPKIYFLPGENNASSRRIRMLNDMLLLSRDSPPRYRDEASLILVSGQLKGDRPYITVFRLMESRHYYLVLVTPSKQPEDPNVWPGLLMDEAYHLLT